MATSPVASGLPSIPACSATAYLGGCRTIGARRRWVKGMADLDAVLGALRAPARREILGLIWQRELPAGEIAAAFSLSAATISEHLAVLRRAGLIEMTRVGTSRRYRARPEA